MRVGVLENLVRIKELVEGREGFLDGGFLQLDLDDSCGGRLNAELGKPQHFGTL